MLFIILLFGLSQQALDQPEGKTANPIANKIGGGKGRAKQSAEEGNMRKAQQGDNIKILQNFYRCGEQKDV